MDTHRSFPACWWLDGFRSKACDFARIGKDLEIFFIGKSSKKVFNKRFMETNKTSHLTRAVFLPAKTRTRSGLVVLPGKSNGFVMKDFMVRPVLIVDEEKDGLVSQGIQLSTIPLVGLTIEGRGASQKVSKHARDPELSF